MIVNVYGECVISPSPHRHTGRVRPEKHKAGDSVLARISDDLNGTDRFHWQDSGRYPQLLLPQDRAAYVVARAFFY